MTTLAPILISFSRSVRSDHFFTDFGNAGGIINGSIINYSEEQMSLGGNNDLYFNRSGTDTVPAGFVPEIVLHYDPVSYSEVTL